LHGFRTLGLFLLSLPVSYLSQFVHTYLHQDGLCPLYPVVSRGFWKRPGMGKRREMTRKKEKWICSWKKQS
jgi:hypothetical protein